MDMQVLQRCATQLYSAKQHTDACQATCMPGVADAFVTSHLPLTVLSVLHDVRSLRRHTYGQ